MKIIFYSQNLETIDEWKMRHDVDYSVSFYDEESLIKALTLFDEYVLIADFDSVASSINKMIAANTLPQNTIVLERVPEVVTGKMLIAHGVKAYGNARMLTVHYMQMIETIFSGDVWTYPELTISLVKSVKMDPLSEEARVLVEKKLTEKEIDVVCSIIEGLINDAIAHKLGVTTRTVKAHITSIFSKLRVNDRLALVLLLK